jgi:hypothetical protein
MPKDATKNVDRYKIRGGQLNEFDFHQNQEDLATKQQVQNTDLIPGTSPEKKRTTATRSRKATKSTKVAKGRKATKPTKAVKGASAKKLASRKAAKKAAKK